MYEELVKDLRAVAQTFELTGRGSGRQARLPRQAADAIDELESRLKELESKATRAEAKAALKGETEDV